MHTLSTGKWLEKVSEELSLSNTDLYCLLVTASLVMVGSYWSVPRLGEVPGVMRGEGSEERSQVLDTSDGVKIRQISCLSIISS